MNDQSNLPVVEEEALAKILGLKEWTYRFKSSDERMAARVLTDTVAHGLSQEVAMQNAVAWISMARVSGYKDGVAAERGLWKKKIARIFGVE